MDLGLATFPTDESIRPDALARLAEERGFESLFFPEHTHIPVGGGSPYFGAPANAEGIESLRRAGVDRALFMVSSDGPDRAEARVDALAALQG